MSQIKAIKVKEKIFDLLRIKLEEFKAWIEKKPKWFQLSFFFLMLLFTLNIFSCSPSKGGFPDPSDSKPALSNNEKTKAAMAIGKSDFNDCITDVLSSKNASKSGEHSLRVISGCMGIEKDYNRRDFCQIVRGALSVHFKGMDTYKQMNTQAFLFQMQGICEHEY